jgi:PAS domain S-box-containing protein
MVDNPNNRLERELTELRQVQKALKDSEELHRITLSSISDAVFLTKNDGGFVYICPNVDVIFKYSYNEVSEFKNISKLLGKKIFDPKRLNEGGEISNIERKITDKIGGEHILLVNVKNVSIKGATLLFTCRDITERKYAEEELEKAKQELEVRVEERTRELRAANEQLKKLDEMKSNFISKVTHELKSPLGLVSGYIEVLSEKTVDDEQAELIRVIQSNVQRLNSLVNDILDLSRLESGKITFSMGAHDVNTTIHEIVSDFKPLIAEKNLSMNLALADESIVYGDAERIRQVFSNLIENSIKFSERGGKITISSSSLYDSTEFVVSDEGCGIPKGKEEKIFEKFYQAGEQGSETFSGTGLGLAIVKEIISAHAGSIVCEPRRGSGSVFRITLPKNR